MWDGGGEFEKQTPTPQGFIVGAIPPVPKKRLVVVARRREKTMKPDSVNYWCAVQQKASNVPVQDVATIALSFECYEKQVKNALLRFGGMKQMAEVALEKLMSALSTRWPKANFSLGHPSSAGHPSWAYRRENKLFFGGFVGAVQSSWDLVEHRNLVVHHEWQSLRFCPPWVEFQSQFWVVMQRSLFFPTLRETLLEKLEGNSCFAVAACLSCRHHQDHAILTWVEEAQSRTKRWAELKR